MGWGGMASTATLPDGCATTGMFAPIWPLWAVIPCSEIVFFSADCVRRRLRSNVVCAKGFFGIL